MQLPDEFLWPDYEGGSIANVPATVAAMLGSSFDGLPSLRPELWKPMASGVKRVVLFLVDAWGWNLFQQQQAALAGLLRRATVTGRLTSVFPSTTVAALSSLWTGAAPAQHSLVGLRLFFPDYAVTGQLLAFTPAFGKYPDALIEAGLDPETFLRRPGFAEQLAAAGVETHAFKGREIIHSALSRMHGRGVIGNHGVSSVADMLVQMRQLLEGRAGEPLFISAYWPTVDTLSHIYGWNHDSVSAELRAILTQLEREFLDALSPAARQDTALLVLADHGQALTPVSQQVYLEDHPALREMLFMKPAGEPRTAYIYAKHDRQNDIVDYVNTHLSQAMFAIPAAEALEAGLLGAPPHARETAERVGDVIITMRQGHVLLTAAERQKAHQMQGRHGGLTRDEMSVPWLGFRLDT